MSSGQKESWLFAMTEARARFLRFFFSGLFFSSLFLSLQANGWVLLDRWQIKGHRDFIDLNSVLGSADCYKSIGFDIYNYPIGHECAYNYGSWLMRTISFIGLGERHTYVVGSIFIVLISYLVAFVMTRNTLTRSSLFFGLLIFISPPIMLLLERGNIDTLMFVLVTLSALIIASGNLNTGLFVIFITVLYKFYTVGLAILLAFFCRSKVNLFIWLSVISLAVVQILNDFRSGPGFINTEWTSFGAPVFGIYLKYFNIKIPYLLSLIFGFLILILATWFVSRTWTPLYKIYKELQNASLETIPSYYLFIFFAIIHTTCYILGMNFDYRLIMLAIANFILMSQAGLRPVTNLIIGITTVLIMWTSYNLQFSQPVGDILIGIVTAIYIHLIWIFFKNLPIIALFIKFRPQLLRRFLP
jgi:hypothetical protein